MDPSSALRRVGVPWSGRQSHGHRAGRSVAGLIALWRAWLRDPRGVGALAPTPRWCSEAVVGYVPDQGSPTVIELGAGTGTIADAAMRRTAGRVHYLAIEVDAELVSYLHRTRPWLHVVHGDALDVPAAAAERALAAADTVLNTLPSSLLSEAARQRLLRAVTAILTPHGRFVSLLTPLSLLRRSGWRYLGQLHRHFGAVTARPTWRTISPAIVVVASDPHPSRARADR